jgi:hypothetical protein
VGFFSVRSMNERGRCCRTTTRVAALQKLHKILLQYLPVEDVSETFVKKWTGGVRAPTQH